ncbi:TetR/AcrR family transcriptional regulator [Nocardioides jejuensis]|uniref:TetR/AcrR family transcriptional regulator n=1 Tax=Nocardioides jejuensis TaxID=2502782 RepID=A0A4R1CHH8_9ACTN|nr:TetR/AcrR family transcriptional regulator [Nocardioides jejuensis]TCJ30639.1 TetR/AcrR family transcriptional regulator [Nocardioides jejuensis]
MATPETKQSYHHGDLRAALLTSAMEMLEEGEPFSLRAVARKAGVSPTAPYRHFEDREAIESALAAQGLKDLMADLTNAGAMPSKPDDLADFGITYVNFALRRPALFKLMFGQECDVENDQRVEAAAKLHDLLASVMENVFPGQDAHSLASGGWALAHGLAFLHLDGKMKAATTDEVAARVRAAFHALLSAQIQPKAD